MANRVVHFEIHASQPQVLVDFYRDLFGWTFTQFGELDYWSIDTGHGQPGSDPTGIDGGLTRREGPAPERGAPVNGCNVVVGVDGSIDELFQKGIDLGATEAVPLTDMAGIGRVGYLLDPDGNVLGLISAMLSDGTEAMSR